MGANAERDLFALVLRGEMKTAAIRRSENTRLGYSADWKNFTSWCKAQGHESLPAASATVLLYCYSLLESKRRVSTAIRHLSAINSYHQAAGLPAPADSEIWQFLIAVRRMRGEQPRQKHALSVEQLRAMCAAFAATPKGARDRCVLTLGYGSGLRRSNLVALDLRDIEFCEEGLMLTIRKEKQDRKGDGRIVGVMRGDHPETCPVRALEAWLRIRGRFEGPLLNPCKGGCVQRLRLRPAHIARIVKDAARSIGLDAANLAGHSMRSGMVTTALCNGVNEVLIMAHVGHKSLATLRKYFRRASPFRANVSGMLGL